MAKYSYGCICGFRFDCLRSTPPKTVPCPECKLEMTRQGSPATARMVEVLDNGMMTRRVERPANAEQLYKDRARDSEIDKHKL